MSIGFHFDDIEEAYFSSYIAQQKRGYWIKDDGFRTCSACGYKLAGCNLFIDDGEKWVPCFADKYCGNCGAKMMEVKNE